MHSLNRKSVKQGVGQAFSEKRRETSMGLSKSRREAFLRGKRMRKEESVMAPSGGLMEAGESKEESKMEEEVPYDEEKIKLEVKNAVENLRECVSGMYKNDPKKRVFALQQLRRLLSSEDYLPFLFAIESNIIPLLISSLQFNSQEEQILESAWIITNISSCDSDLTKECLPTTALLISHMGEGSTSAVAEQCAWAVGNIASESEEFKKILLSQGALKALTNRILTSGSQSKKTYLWTLSHLINVGDARIVSELMNEKHFDEKIISFFNSEDADVAVEAAWVVSYMTSLSFSATQKLMALDLSKILAKKIFYSNEIATLIPVIRITGNICSGENSLIDILLNSANDMVEGGFLNLFLKLLQFHHRALQKESIWCLSNICGGSVFHKKLIFENKKIMEIILNLFFTSPFDIKKEIAYVIANLCVFPTENKNKNKQFPNVDEEKLVYFINMNCVHIFISFLKSHDLEASKIGLQFIEMVLRAYPNNLGAKIIENKDGIDALESLQYIENDENRNFVNYLLDKYYGNDYGLDD